MSSDFERLLREGRKALPEPSDAVTRRARERAIAAARRRRSLRRPAAAILAVALVGVGVGIGALIAPSGSAAPAPLGLGFLPERGWSVVQNGGDGTVVQPAGAIASNVELSPNDDPDGLPLSTLKALPPEGIVVIASFTSRGDEPWHDKGFPARKLPLGIDEAEPFGVQVRPGRPLGQYALRAGVNGHNVDVNVYFGTPNPSMALLAAAQRQLNRLVVRPVASKPAVSAGAAARLDVKSGAATAPATVFDRTFTCMPSYERLDVVVSPHGANEVLGARFTSSGYVRLTSGSGGDLLSDLVAVARPGLRTSSTRFPAAVYASSRRCVVSRAFVPVTRAGLPGPAATWSTADACAVRGRVLIRVRAVLGGSATWGRLGTAIVGARGRVSEAAIAVRDQTTGKPLAFAKLSRAGTTQLWTSSQCQ